MEKLRQDIDKLDPQSILDLYNKSYNKIQDLDNRIKKFSLYTVLVIFFYLISTNSNLNEIQVGPVSITSLPEAINFMPLLFAYLFLELATSTFHRFEVNIFSQYLFTKINPQIVEKEKINSFIHIIFPFSIWSEIMKIDFKNGLGCLAFCIIVFLPTLSIFLLPIGFEILLLKKQSTCLSNTISIITFCLSIWLMLVAIWYTISAIRYGIKEKLIS